MKIRSFIAVFAVAGSSLYYASSIRTQLSGSAKSGNPMIPYKVGSNAFLNMPPNDSHPLPQRLSQTGAFRDTKNLVPAEGLLPYDINAPFWSDGASKGRWISLPSGTGAHDVTFDAIGPWKFPAGTVFVKNFGLKNADGASSNTKVETRLLVRDDRGGVYGASYRWRADGSDADLVSVGTRAVIPVVSNDGQSTHPWYFPGMADCQVCHTRLAGSVLGVNARQMNKAFGDPNNQGAIPNQIARWSLLGIFSRSIPAKEIAGLAHVVPPDDKGSSLELQARSYLDVNCAMCHMPGGVSGNFDARFRTRLAQQNLVNGLVRINLGIDGARTIVPNDVSRSIIAVRTNTLEAGIKMPPLAHEVIDVAGAAMLRRWIASMPAPAVLAAPTIRPAGGDFTSPVLVIISNPDKDAIIRYTLDGEPPEVSSARYTGPIRISSPTTLRASAWKSGMKRSITAQETFVVRP